MSTLPAKLTPDAIREALVEVRFEHTEIPEVIVGGLAGEARWSAFTKSRLPAAEIPAPITEATSNFRYLATIQLTSPEGTELIRVGPRVISYHVLSPYIGWEAFLPKLMDMLDTLFRVCPTATIPRLGLRYINALSQELHFTGSVFDLNLSIEVDSKKPSDDVLLAYQVRISDDLQGMVRLSSPSFVEGGLPAPADAMVDIDMFTPLTFSSQSAGAVGEWLVRAHEAEKGVFFSLLRPHITDKLKER